MLTGRFQAEEVNKCVGAMSYAGIFYKRLIAGEIDEMPLACDISMEEPPCRPAGG